MSPCDVAIADLVARTLAEDVGSRDVTTRGAGLAVVAGAAGIVHKAPLPAAVADRARVPIERMVAIG